VPVRCAGTRQQPLERILKGSGGSRVLNAQAAFHLQKYFTNSKVQSNVVPPATDFLALFN